MPTAGSFSSVLSSGVGQLIAGIVGLAAIYKFFIEFVEPDEMAVRAHNNKPDFYHHRMSWTRRCFVFGSVVVMIGSLVFMIHNRWGNWYFGLGTTVVSILVFQRALATWPRTDVVALVGPGFKWKIPGLIAYKRAKVAVFTRTVDVTERVDASRQLVNVGLAYDWSRGSHALRELWESRVPVVRLIPDHRSVIIETGQLLWRSLFGAATLEDSLDGIVREAVLRVTGTTSDMTQLSGDDIATFCATILHDCEPLFREKFGATLYAVRLVRTGPPSQVFAAEKLVHALERTPTSLNGLLTKPFK